MDAGFQPIDASGTMPDGTKFSGLTDFRNILLIKLSALGDVVHTFPVLNKLRRRYPAARLDWLVTPGIAELPRPGK